MTNNDLHLFAEFIRPMIGMKVSCVWMGYGSAIFLELGETHFEVRANGRLAKNPTGEMTLHACEGWRVEGKRRVWFGSWTEKERSDRYIKVLEGSSISSAYLVGTLGEIQVCFSNGLRFGTFMTNQGNPDWSLSNSSKVYMHVTAAKVDFDLRSQIVS